jgi:hypothetical protein
MNTERAYWTARLENAEVKLAQIVRLGRDEKKGSTRTTEDYRYVCDLIAKCKAAIKANA